jgi:hypothetical protein
MDHSGLTAMAFVHRTQRDAMLRDVLTMWTIYDHPRDFPSSYVARCWENSARYREPIATDKAIEGELSMLRHLFADCGLACLTRNEGDDPKIVETWV